MRARYKKLFDLTEIPDFRVKGDLLRTAAAHMVLRHFDRGKSKDIYTEQDYCAEDMNFISQRLNSLVEPRIKPLVAGYTSGSRKRDDVRSFVCSFLEACNRRGRVGAPLRAIVAYAKSKMPDVHYQTVNNALQELVTEGKVERVADMHGYYRLVEKQGA